MRGAATWVLGVEAAIETFRSENWRTMSEPIWVRVLEGWDESDETGWGLGKRESLGFAEKWRSGGLWIRLTPQRRRAFYYLLLSDVRVVGLFGFVRCECECGYGLSLIKIFYHLSLFFFIYIYISGDLSVIN